jgi:hypothetical protein
MESNMKENIKMIKKMGMVYLNILTDSNIVEIGLMVSNMGWELIIIVKIRKVWVNGNVEFFINGLMISSFKIKMNELH